MTWRTKNINIELSDVTVTVDDAALRSDVLLVWSDTKLMTTDGASVLSDTRLVATDTGAIKTAIELIDHLTAANAGAADANTQRVTLANDDALVAVLNAGMNIFTATGKSVTDMEFVSIAQAGAGVAEVCAEVTGHHYYILGYQGSLTGTGTMQFRETDDTPVYSGAMNLGANGGFGLVPSGIPLFWSDNGKGIELVTVDAGFNGTVQFLDITE